MANNQEVPAEELVSATANAETAEAEERLLSAEEIGREIKPLSQNGFLAFWQKIWRAWLGVWYGFSDNHPKLSKFLYQFVLFFVFSNGVTIWQYLVMTFLPYAFGGLSGTVFAWPNVPVEAANNIPYIIFGDANGLGNFIAFEIAVFTAQCINFPLQRNITFKSKGNPVVQGVWYFIGWVLISVFVNALWGIMNCFLTAWGWAEAVKNILKTVITGGISMLIFFFIFLIIFPDGNKVAKSARAKADKLKAEGAPADKVAAAELVAVRKEENARVANARNERYKTMSQANSRAVAFGSVVRNTEKLKSEVAELDAALAATVTDAAAKAGDGNERDKLAETRAKYETAKARIPEYQKKASAAIAAKHAAAEKYDAAVAEVNAARTARGEAAGIC